MGEEKRRYVRWREKIRVAYTRDENGQSYQEIFTEDISEDGLQILVSDELHLLQPVRLKLEFAYDSVPIVAAAVVANVKTFQDQYRVGLKFVNMSDFQKQRLKRCLDKAKQQDFKDEAGKGNV